LSIWSGIKVQERKRYSNLEACGKCQFKDQCTVSKKGREISRAKDQDFLDIVDLRTAANKKKYRKRQSIIEHVFDKVKRTMNYECRFFPHEKNKLCEG
jgi:hypothetical protein